METIIEDDDLYEIDPVPTDVVGWRLDKWLATKLPEISRTRICALITDGYVGRNGEVCKDPANRIKEGECYDVKVPKPVPCDVVAEDIPLDILFEDDDLVVVNKPAGMVVHPGAGNWTGTLVNALLFYCKGRLSGIGGQERPGIVHRIDKETSGILVVAKSDVAHNALAALFQKHDIERVYYAVVWGVPDSPAGTIRGNIARSKANRQKMAIVREGGREAITHYKVIKVLAGGAASLIECRLETGRTHQIRVHLTSVGHPLIGDKLYNENRPSKKAMSAEQKMMAEGFARQVLHAGVLGFVHPVTGKQMHFEVPIPKDMQDLITVLT